MVPTMGKVIYFIDDPSTQDKNTKNSVTVCYHIVDSG